MGQGGGVEKLIAAGAALLRSLGAGVLAGAFLALFEVIRLAPREAEEFEAMAILLRRLLVLGGLAGLGLGLASLLRRLLHFLGRRRDLVLVVLLLLSLAPLLVDFSDRLLSGQGIARLSQLPLLLAVAPWVLGLLVGVLALAVMRLEDFGSRGGPLRAAALTLLLLGLVAGGDWIDAHLYVGLYPDIHLLLALGALVGSAGGMILLLGLLPRRGLIAGTLILLALLSALADQGQRADAQSRYLLIKKTLHGRRVIDLWKQFRVEGDHQPEAVVFDADFAAARRESGARAAALQAALTQDFGELRPRNLLWITIDTLRRDGLGCFGAQRPVSPNIDRLAEQSLVLARHWAQFPLTNFSFQSAFFSRYPEATPLYRRISNRPDDAAGSRTIAALLGEAGFRTISIPGIAASSLEHPGYAALGEGFEEVDPGGGSQRSLLAPEQTKLALAALDAGDERPFFLWVHYMDPHENYVAHAEHPFGSSKRDRYDSEVAFTDAAIGSLLDGLAARGLSKDTLVILNSDHGEAFGEHGTYFHGTTLYEEQIAVPAIIHLPGGRPGKIEFPSANVDLMPTALDLLGVPATTPMQGQSMAGYFLAEPDPVILPLPFAFAEIPDAVREMAPANRNRQALIEGDLKLIANRRDDFVELYDLATDPAESLNLASRRPEIVTRMLGMIRVIQQEAMLINVPESERSEDDYYTALRESLVAGPIPSRSRLIEGCLTNPEPRLAEILLERLADPHEHELIKLVIIDRGAAFLGDAIMPALRELVAKGRAIGLVASVLDIWRRERLPVAAGDQEVLAAALLRNPQVGWRAARLLADQGDERARLQLEPAMKLGCERTAFESACSLGLLGDQEALPVLLEGLVHYSREPRLCAEALRALARLGDRSALPQVIAILRDRYVHYRVKSAALDYLDAVPGEAALAGFVQLSNGWDPEMGRQVKARLAARVGNARAERIIAAGLAREEIDELTTLGRHADAHERCAAAIAALETPAAGALYRLLDARLLMQLQRGAEARALLETFDGAATEIPPSWLAAAQALAASAPASSYQIELLELEAVERGPLALASEALFRLRLRNAGTTLVAGGRDFQSPRFRLMADDEAESGQAFVTDLPAPGLAPGATIDLLVRMTLPGPRDRFSPRLSAFRIDGGAIEIVDRRQQTAIVRVSHADEGGLDPRELAFDGRLLLEEWAPSPAFFPGVLMPDGRAAYLARGLDPILVSPLLQDCGRALEVEVRFTAESTAAGFVTDFELFWRFADQANFLPQQHQAARYPIDGEARVLSFRIEAQGGRSARQIRFDFFQEPELVVIESVTIRALD